MVKEKSRATRFPGAPSIVAVATALPRHVIRQDEAVDGARRIFSGRLREFERFAPAFLNTGIETRHSCVPIEWYFEPHGWGDRNTTYLENAINLLERATLDACRSAGIAPAEIASIITVSSTGIATPSLEARLAERLDLPPRVRRTPLFGLGCAGGVTGLARAAMDAAAHPGQYVLMLAVELCGLSFRRDDLTKSNIIATALFGDGAAAVLVRSNGQGPSIGPIIEHRFPDSLGVMGWDVEDDGLGVVFSRDIPTLVEREFRPVLREFLAEQGLGLGDLQGAVSHPGGTKVLTALEGVLELPEGALDPARAVLARCGNMSSVTVLFVLEEMLRRGAGGLHAVTAFGPGFSAALGLLDLMPLPRASMELQRHRHADLLLGD